MRESEGRVGEPLCQSFEASSLESLIEHLVLTALEPAAVELSLTAAGSIESERERIERHHLQAVERATYEASLARRRYEEVDPSNRLVAAELERNWESRLQTQRKAEESLNRFRQETPSTLTPEQRHSILQLASDFSMLWHSSSTTNIDRQAIVRSLIKDIVVDVVDNTERLSVTVHWAGGFESQHETRRHVRSFDQLDGAAHLAERIQQLYNGGYPLSEIAKQLNHEDYKPAKQERFTRTSMGALCRMLRRRGVIAATPNIKPHYWRAGKLCESLGIKKPTLSGWPASSPQPMLFKELPSEPVPDRVTVDVCRLRVERPREFGAVWPALKGWRKLRPDQCLEERLPPGQEEIAWAAVITLLVVARFCNLSSELHIADSWYRSTAWEDLLGVPIEKVNPERLYRALDRALPLKAQLEKHLRQHWGGCFKSNSTCCCTT